VLSAAAFAVAEYDEHEEYTEHVEHAHDENCDHDFSFILNFRNHSHEHDEDCEHGYEHEHHNEQSEVIIHICSPLDGPFLVTPFCGLQTDPAAPPCDGSCAGGGAGGGGGGDGFLFPICTKCGNVKFWFIFWICTNLLCW